MEKIVLLVIKEEYADWEAAYLSTAVKSLSHGEYEVKTVSWEEKAVGSMGGFRVLPDYELDQVPEEYEAVILIGGTGWRKPDARQIKPLIQQCMERGKVIGGICDAATFLGTLGILNSVRHTCNDLSDLKSWAGDAYTGEALHQKKQAVRDHQVITANGTAPLEFAREVLMALKVTDEKSIMDWYRFHKAGLYEE